MVHRFHVPSIVLGVLGVLGWVVAGLIGVGWGNVAVAQSGVVPGHASGAVARSQSESPVAERQRVRGELERVQAQIDQLKKADRGLRTDYQLRARMADAEALARRLTELDALVKQRPSSDASAPATVFQERVVREPAAAPTDGPAELEAKADILADQSRRVKLQVGVLKARIDQLRGRQELRRRARQLDNDPFAPLEGSKRRLVTVNTGAVSNAAPAAPASGTATDRAPTTVTTAPGATSLGVATKTTNPPTPLDFNTPSSSAPSVQLHDVLDPVTLAQIRKLEQDASSPSADLDSMQLALSSLLARAQHLDAQSNLLRAKARAH